MRANGATRTSSVQKPTLDETYKANVAKREKEPPLAPFQLGRRINFENITGRL